MTTINQDDEPKTYDEAIAGEERDKWQSAVDQEVNALIDNETWTVVNEKPRDTQVIDCKWVFKKKRDENGVIAKYKARLVARGFKQKVFYDNDVYSPVAKLPSVRMFLSCCNKLGIGIYQLDVCSAFSKWRSH